MFINCQHNVPTTRFIVSNPPFVRQSISENMYVVGASDWDPSARWLPLPLCASNIYRLSSKERKSPQILLLLLLIIIIVSLHY